MAKAQIEIGKRAAEEAFRLFEKSKDAQRAICGNNNGLIYHWQEGVAPSAKYIQRLHYCGADVIYILTGRRGIYELPKVQQQEYKGRRHAEWPSK